MEYEDSADEWFESFVFDTHFRGSREEWAATRCYGIKNGELETWIHKRELGLVGPRSGSQKIIKTRIDKYPWCWPIARDIAICTYTNKKINICPCVINRRGWIYSKMPCEYKKKMFELKKKKKNNKYNNMNIKF